MEVWSGRQECEVTDANVEWLAGTWSGRQECENDGGEVSAAHIRRSA